MLLNVVDADVHEGIMSEVTSLKRRAGANFVAAFLRRYRIWILVTIISLLLGVSGALMFLYGLPGIPKHGTGERVAFYAAFWPSVYSGLISGILYWTWSYDGGSPAISMMPSDTHSGYRTEQNACQTRSGCMNRCQPRRLLLRLAVQRFWCIENAGEP